MSKTAFDDLMGQIEVQLASRTSELDGRWAEFTEAVNHIARLARSVSFDLESAPFTIEENSQISPGVYGSLYISVFSIGLSIPDPFHHDDPHGIYGVGYKLSDVPDPYKLLILGEKLHVSLAEALHKKLNNDDEIIGRKISIHTQPRPEPEVTVLAQKLGWSAVHRCWEKAIIRATSDPASAITQAGTLLEGVAKHILEKRGVDLPKKQGSVVPLALKTLGLEEQEYIQIRKGIDQIRQSISTTRNTKSGDAHALSPGDPVPDSKEARLYVTLAGALSAYLMGIHIETLDPAS